MNEDHGSDKPPEGPSPFQFLGLGFEIAVPLLVGLFGGQWLDRRFGTAPWLLLAGVLVGAAAGAFSLYRRVVPPGGPGRGGAS